MKQSAEINRRVSGFTARTLATLGLMMVLLLLVSPTPATEKAGSKFDHLTTGFPLTGAHAHAECQTCHVRGTFKGTPKQCSVCHTQGSRMASTTKPAKHVQTTGACDQCHSTAVTWTGARFRHTGVVPGSCMTCHNGNTAQGKPANHVQTTSSCDTCHRTTAWIPAGYNHAGVTPGTCATCHNGSTAPGKHPRHLQTTASCDACHRTTFWIPTLPSAAIHAGVVPGTCATCHNGTTATGKPTTHMVTTKSCDACHTTNPPWTTIRYTHTSPNYKIHNAGATCKGCHTTNNEVIAWKFGAYVPDCAACHADKYKADSHKKTEAPTTILYTVAELKNCAGSCHLYTDSTFSSIKTPRSSRHRSTDGGF